MNGPMTKRLRGTADWASKDFDWGQARRRLWTKLVPATGQAKTVQGEVIRITGKLTDEAYRNGNCNWDRDCAAMWRFAGRVLDDPETFSAAVRARIRKTVRAIIRDRRRPDVLGIGSTYYYMLEMAARWCAAHPVAQPHAPNPSLHR